MKKRILSLVLAFTLVLGMFPFAAVTANAAATQTHTITFYVGSSIYETQKVEHGKYAKVPADPYREGYFFNNWCTEDGEEFDFSAPVTKDFDLVALFEEDEETQIHIITFYVGSSIYETQKIEHGKYAKVPADPYREGYFFNNWCTEDGEEFDFSAPVTKDFNLVALFEEDEDNAFEKPDAPVIKVSSVASTGKNKVTWEAVARASDYEVYYCTSKNGTYTFAATTNKLSYTHNSAKAGTRYYYYVVAIDYDANESDKSNIVSRICDLPQPTGVKASNVTSTGKNKITWDSVAGATGYEVYRSTSKNGTYSRLGSATKTSYTNTGAVAGKQYYYKVKAIHSNSNANSAFSDIVSRTCDLPQVTGVKASNVTSTGKIKITWNMVDGASKYEVWRATAKNGTYSRLGSATKTSYTNTSATAGKTYYYKVKAVHSNDNANSAFSSIVSRTCDLARPDVTISLSSGKPRLKWEKVSGATKYEVYRATSESGTYKLLKTTTNASLTNTSATSGKTYYYKVKAIHSNSNANSGFSTVKSIKSK